MTRRTLLAGATGAALVPLARAASAFELVEADRYQETHHFVSELTLKPPKVHVLHREKGTAPGLLFVTPSSGPGQRGVLVVDDTGQPVWFRQTPHVAATNLRAGVYKGRPVLSWWEGKTTHGLGDGDHVIVDASYREIARFPAGGGKAADLHELILTPQGTALVTAWDLKNNVVEGIVQELEIPSAKVLFEWRSLDHVPTSETYAGVGPQFDYFHINSIDIHPSGDLLVSARNTWTVYRISRPSGKVVWRLGGKKSDFKIGKGARFSWQHDARALGATRLTLFDNADSPQEEPQTRGLVLALDEARREATLVRGYTHAPPVLAHMFGSVQAHVNGNVLVGWGASPLFTEYASDGRVLFDATLPAPGGQSYRALRFPWIGRPAAKPALAVKDGRLYASWNGSTETRSWRLSTGRSAGALATAGSFPRRGFETSFALPGGARYAAVTALDAAGRPLATSDTTRV
jgi:Arylsulfotransferase (ASST)